MGVLRGWFQAGGASGPLEGGPFRDQVSDDLFDPTPGELPAYEYHWTIADFYNAMTEPGCELIALDEVGDQAESWEQAPLAGLPQVIILAARKRAQ